LESVGGSTEGKKEGSGHPDKEGLHFSDLKPIFIGDNVEAGGGKDKP